LTGALSLPSKFNWKDSGVVTPAKDQGGCGSCWAFTATGAVESKILMGKGPAYDLSEQQQVSCDTDCYGCGGGFMSAFEFWEKTGPLLESCARYSAMNEPCSHFQTCQELPYRVDDYYEVNSTDVNSIKQSLITDGPAYFGFTLYDDFWAYWYDSLPGAVYKNNNSGIVDGRHSAQLIGWDDSKNAFLFKNSWGAAEGPNKNGTFWMAYDGHANYMGFNVSNCKIKKLASLTLEMRELTPGSSIASKPQIRITNLSGDSISDFTIRLWLSREEYTDRDVALEFYHPSPAGLTFTVSEDTANYDIIHVDIKYPASFLLGPHQSTPDIGAECQIHFKDWAAVWKQSNDWSWQGIGSAWTATNNISVYDNNGLLICGAQPIITPKKRPTPHDIMRFETVDYWSASSGVLQSDSIRKSEGRASLRVNGGGYQILTSRYIQTSAISCEATGVINFDIANFDAAPDHYWVGSLTLAANCPSALLYNVIIGSVNLTGLPTKTFRTQQMNLPASVISALNGNYKDFVFTYTFNTRAGSGPYYLDKMYFSPGWTATSASPLSDPWTASQQSIASLNGDVYVAYGENDSTGTHCNVKKLLGTTWQLVGAPHFANGYIGLHSLVMYNGTPYVCFGDNANSGRISVKKFIGNSWVYVGAPGFSQGPAVSPCLSIDNGTLYVLFGDFNNAGKATVMKFNGSKWVNFGTPGFSGSYCYNSDLSVKNGIAYAALSDNETNTKLSVMQCSGSQWNYLGNANFSTGYPSAITIAVDNATPYVCYNEYISGSVTLTVQKFNGTNWVPAGIVNSGKGYNASMVIANHTLYIAFGDPTVNLSITVMQYVNNAWSPIGCPGISSPGTWGPALAISGSAAYVAFLDPSTNLQLTVMQYK
jgi:hypothetical protein